MSLTTVTYIKCPGCGHLTYLLPILDDFHIGEDGALECHGQCSRCDMRATLRITTRWEAP